MAVAERNAAAVSLLLANGADASLRTRIDDYETALEMAKSIGEREIIELLADH
jgi:ankyrin repeat protein